MNTLRAMLAAALIISVFILCVVLDERALQTVERSKQETYRGSDAGYGMAGQIKQLKSQMQYIQGQVDTLAVRANRVEHFLSTRGLE